MRDCVERGKGGGTSMGKLVGNEAKLLNDAFLAGRTFLDPLTVKAEIYALSDGSLLASLAVSDDL